MNKGLLWGKILGPNDDCRKSREKCPDRNEECPTGCNPCPKTEEIENDLYLL